MPFAVLFAEGLATNMFLVGLALTVGMLLFRSRFKNRRQAAVSRPSVVSRPKATQARVPREAGQEAWQVEMHELSRELTGRLDSKIALLEGLIRDARQEAARLEALLQQVPASDARPQAPRRRAESLPAGHQAQALAAALLREAGAVPTFGDNAGVPPSGGNEQPAEAGTPTIPTPANGTPTTHRFEQIYSLADTGHDPAAIARQVGSPVGEVELILSLRRKGSNV